MQMVGSCNINAFLISDPLKSFGDQFANERLKMGRHQKTHASKFIVRAKRRIWHNQLKY